MLTDNLLDVDEGSEAEADILALLTEANLDQEFISKWKPAKMQLILTKSHKTEYEGKC